MGRREFGLILFKAKNETLKRVQGDKGGLFFSFCHPEPGPELNSGSIDFEIYGFGLVLYFLYAPCSLRVSI